MLLTNLRKTAIPTGYVVRPFARALHFYRSLKIHSYLVFIKKIVQYINNIIALLQMRDGAQRGSCPSATYKTIESSNLKWPDSQMCTFLLPNCCSPKTGGLTGSLTLRMSFGSSMHHCLHLYNGGENRTSQRCWTAFRKLYIFFYKMVHLISFQIHHNIRNSILLLFLMSLLSDPTCFSSILNTVYLCLLSLLQRVSSEVSPLYRSSPGKQL